MNNLWELQKKKKQARQVLAKADGQFSEDFTSRDPQEADALFAELQIEPRPAILTKRRLNVLDLAPLGC